VVRALPGCSTVAVLLSWAIRLSAFSPLVCSPWSRFHFLAILKSTLGIRVSAEEEMKGLDIGEHGMEAYSGFLKDTTDMSGVM
jgi:ammonia channel protein AmtB